jgi:hypothetical protein
VSPAAGAWPLSRKAGRKYVHRVGIQRQDHKSLTTIRSYARFLLHLGRWKKAQPEIRLRRVNSPPWRHSKVGHFADAAIHGGGAFDSLEPFDTRLRRFTLRRHNVQYSGLVPRPGHALPLMVGLASEAGRSGRSGGEHAQAAIPAIDTGRRIFGAEGRSAYQRELGRSATRGVDARTRGIDAWITKPPNHSMALPWRSLAISASLVNRDVLGISGRIWCTDGHHNCYKSSVSIRSLP